MEIKSFENKLWLSSPTMHGDELKYMKEAYDTNWMSTLGENIDEVARMVCKMIVAKARFGRYPSRGYGNRRLIDNK